jgi:hypothetical protein
VAIFEALGKTYRLKRLLWTSEVSKLDASLVMLEPMVRIADACPLKPPPLGFDGSGKQRVYVIGYPLGAGLSISLQDSYWLDSDGTFMRYRTPTEQGSSGSPVFDDKKWVVIGLHHRGKQNLPKLKNQGGTEAANEAISMSAIVAAVRTEGVRTAYR